MSITKLKDPVHGYIKLPDGILERIVDTPVFQRLRYVRQLSATHLVYPGATHTRFEHSLGVYHLGKTVYGNLREQSFFHRDTSPDVLDDIHRTLACACLLHDVGHPPFSHIGERLLDTDALHRRLEARGLVDAFVDAGVGSRPLHAASPHELAGCLVVLSVFGDDLRELGVDPFEVCGYILGYSLNYERGETWQHGVAAQILHSSIDVDRLDYIIRDDYMTGADVLQIDTDRMVDAYTAHPDEGLALSDSALSTIGNYLEGRISLYMWVTQHHKSVYANVLLGAMLEELDYHIDEPLVPIDGIVEGRLDDYHLMERLREAAREHPDSTLADLHDRFRSRTFPETCWKHRIAYADRVEADLDDFSAWLLSNGGDIEDRLADDLDVPVHEVWIERSYVPEYAPGELKDIPIAYGGTTQSVAEHGLYGERAFDRPIPFVYVPRGTEDRALDRLNDWYPGEKG